ncbi:hypothetical protein, partial [Chryseobacterium sp.]|uniref:hypothetical protein n=1 Tax=Chryseobacterium sp. TaxID=1871047 RepID=UPI0031E33827
AYADLMDSFQNGGEFSLKVKNGFMSWWTGGAEGDANTAQEMIAHMMKLVQNSSNSLTDNFFNWIQGNPIKVSQFAGMIQAGSTVAEKGLSNWNGASNITKSRIFAETISTKLPFSAKALGTASTVLKGLGTTVGIVGLTNTFYQWKNGNISDTRAIVDGALGVAGFIPATAWISVVYFAGMALYETYGNDGKPLF